MLHLRIGKGFLGVLLGLALLAGSLLCGCQTKAPYEDNRVLLGTFVKVTSFSPQAGKIVFDEIARIEGSLSKYDPQSEVYRLNKSGALRVSAETYAIIKKAKEFWQESNGAFDITVGPLVDLWGFTDKEFTVPPEEKIKNALLLVGSEKIVLNESDTVVEFKLSGMKIDLGGIAKGYALDCAVRRLKEKGITSCLIEVGGQIYCLGDNAGKPWRIGIRNPRHASIAGQLLLKDRSVSTSGDYEQFFIEANKRFSHIINPLSGYPARSGVISVTVIAEDGVTADALSTAIFVLGKEKGEALVKRFPGVEARIIEEKDVYDKK